MANSVDPDQAASLGAVWSGSTLFAEIRLSENLGKLQYFPSPFQASAYSIDQWEIRSFPEFTWCHGNTTWCQEKNKRLQLQSPGKAAVVYMYFLLISRSILNDSEVMIDGKVMRIFHRLLC